MSIEVNGEDWYTSSEACQLLGISYPKFMRKYGKLCNCQMWERGMKFWDIETLDKIDKGYFDSKDFKYQKVKK